MMQLSWRQKFIDLCEGIFRELGFPPPPMLHEDSLPLAMELEVGQAQFELLHSPTAMGSRILVTCRLGEASAEMGLKGMQAMLRANLTLTRSHEAAFGISPDSNEIRCMYYEALDEARPGAMLERMKQLAPDARNWRDRFINEGARTSAYNEPLPSLALP